MFTAMSISESTCIILIQKFMYNITRYRIFLCNKQQLREFHCTLRADSENSTPLLPTTPTG
jgi:hypothetical protein